jgi:hypothetical protein
MVREGSGGETWLVQRKENGKEKGGGGAGLVGQLVCWTGSVGWARRPLGRWKEKEIRI